MGVIGGRQGLLADRTRLLTQLRNQNWVLVCNSISGHINKKSRTMQNCVTCFYPDVCLQIIDQYMLFANITYANI